MRDRQRFYTEERRHENCGVHHAEENHRHRKRGVSGNETRNGNTQHHAGGDPDKDLRNGFRSLLPAYRCRRDGKGHRHIDRMQECRKGTGDEQHGETVGQGGDDVARREKPQRQQHDRPAVHAGKEQRRYRSRKCDDKRENAYGPPGLGNRHPERLGNLGDDPDNAHLGVDDSEDAESEDQYQQPRFICG